MYEDKFTDFNPAWENREIYTNTNKIELGSGYPGMGGENLNVEIWKSRTGKPFYVGIATGRILVHHSFVYLQFVGQIGTDGYGYIKMLYVDQNAGKVVGKASDRDAQLLINGLIYQNKIILENNLLCAGIIKKLEAKGINVSIQQRETLAKLHQRLEERNKRILNSKFLGSKKQSYPTGFSKYAIDLQNFIDDPFNEFNQKQSVPTIGAPIVAVIVVSVVVTALLGWIIYLIFKPDYSQSKSDLKISKELTEALSGLDPETRHSIINDLEGQIDKAYLQGKMDGSGKGMLRTISYAGAGILGFMLLSNIIEKRNVRY
ncbi:MAG: hypothetical protein GX102_15405 [Porphyromonadaceae bacterium]|jgi:hypothetical protein|nr:hypothetical protein [Porphyromonadaceae bacterium]